jgi:hypothetical protein
MIGEPGELLSLLGWRRWPFHRQLRPCCRASDTLSCDSFGIFTLINQRDDPTVQREGFSDSCRAMAYDMAGNLVNKVLALIFSPTALLEMLGPNLGLAD